MTVKPEKQIPGISPVREQTLSRTKEKRINCQTSSNVHLAYSEITLRCCSKNLETLSSSTCTAQSIPGDTFRHLDTGAKRCGLRMSSGKGRYTQARLLPERSR